METKDLAAILLSVLALGLSVYATITAQRKSVDERMRTIRAQLTEVLGKLTSLNIEGAKLQHEARNDHQYLTLVNAALGQQNGFLLDQAVFLSEQIPTLVTTYEFKTIAMADFQAGNVLRAETHQLKAIAAAPTDLYKSQAIRGYAFFLYQLARISEGREQFRRAVDTLKGPDNLVHLSNGYTYQMWALNELHYARSPELASEYFENARKEYRAVDVEFLRNKAMADLEAARTTPQSPVTTFNRRVADSTP